MDNTEKHTAAVLSICTGYGGIELGLELLGINVRPVCYVEREAFCAANLVSKIEAGEMAAAPVFTDAKSFPYERFFGRVDLLTAGYPCQPFSSAGSRRGADDPRHLWPHIAGGIQLCRPGWVFLENVEGHITLGLSTVISDLVEMGYRPTWGIFSAAECLDSNGKRAPHQRKRVFILAHSNGQGLEGSLPSNVHHSEGRQIDGIRRTAECSAGAMADTQRRGRVEDWEQTQLRTTWLEQSPINRWPSRPGEAQQEWEESRTVADTGSKKQHRVPQAEEWNSHSKAGQSGERELAYTGSNALWDKSRGSIGESGESAAKFGVSQQSSRQIEPELGGAVDGPRSWVDPIANRVDRLRMIGNGVCPQTAAKAFATLHAELTQ